MNQNINSAFRLHKIFSEIRNIPYNGKAVEGWAKYFDIKIEDRIELYKDILDKISLIDGEFDIILKAMKDTPLKKERYLDSINSLYSLLPPEELYQNWESMRSRITDNSLNIILICSELMNDEEETINEEDFKKITDELEELKSILSQESLDERLKVFVIDQIKIIQNSLINYRIAGVKTFHPSYYEANTIIIRDTEVLKSEEGKKIFDKLKKAWFVILNISEKVSKVTNMISTSEKLIDIGSKIYNNL